MRIVVWAIMASVLLEGCDAIPGTAQNAAKIYVRERLADPYSAKFRLIATTGTAVCGVVNAKNRMGAYTGAAPFIFDKGSTDVVIFDDPPTVGDVRLAMHADGEREALERWAAIREACTFPQSWRTECGETGIDIPTDAEICTPLLKGDNNAVFDLAERY